MSATASLDVVVVTAVTAPVVAVDAIATNNITVADAVTVTFAVVSAAVNIAAACEHNGRCCFVCCFS